ncbi:uncharacterized protein LOC128677637 [Plodia interpunctella]|uniref:uncharacterized protein LOC128677637 n=1 Tax=Plodia interpunctella TaxID=58824 RepID=UPI0023689995|nr:uncharacterized protein LOC128677637 [Plodia interpunctella]
MYLMYNFIKINMTNRRDLNANGITYLLFLFFSDSPLPEGADLLEIEAISNMISFDAGTDLSDNNNLPATLSDLSQHSPVHKIPDDLSPRSSDTHYPSSPECTTNHLDIDCCNDFCPYFIGDEIREPLSQLSNFTGYSTPQANTPLTCFSDVTSTPDRKKVTRKDKGNIRRQHKNEWMDVKRKKKINLGKAYVTRKGIYKPKKEIKSPCKCRLKCFEKISTDQRKAIFEAFWKLGDHHKQWIYVSNLVSQNHKRRVYVDTQSRRKYTMKYRLPLPDSDSSDENNLIVCKKQFLSTLSISEQFVYTAIQKTDSSTGTVTTDNRGKHQNHPCKMSADVKKSVCDHIECLQPVESHYTRKDNSKLYLDSDLNFHKLFVMYNEWFDPIIYQCKAETERQYKTIVNDSFKLSFFKPKKDQCDVCHKYKISESRTEMDRETYANHIINKNTARGLKTADKKEAISSGGKIVAATFDFQKVLICPYGEISVFYYKRKLATMNFTVFNLAPRTATCYMWHEAEGKRGANEVSSCLSDFISKGVDAGAVEFRFWSDNATGQNRNRIVFAAYMLLAQKYNVIIKHTFLEKGHTQQEGDSVHALIERSAKNKCIYTPLEWFALVRWAKQDGKPYNVVEMDHTKFLDYKSILASKNWAKNTNGEVVQWTKIKEVKVFPSDPNKLLYKYNLDESQYMTIVTRTNTRRRQQDNTNIPPLYDDVLPISLAKKNDLISLCNSGIIPAVHHNFYQSLSVISHNAIRNTDTDSD